MVRGRNLEETIQAEIPKHSTTNINQKKRALKNFEY